MFSWFRTLESMISSPLRRRFLLYDRGGGGVRNVSLIVPQPCTLAVFPCENVVLLLEKVKEK